MPSQNGPVLSKTQVTKAGKILRKAFDGSAPSDAEEYQHAFEVLSAFRTSHVVPLSKTNMGLRSRLKTERCRAEISQRLKRVPTIINKLQREPTMALGNMGDIGGCRAVLDSTDALRRVESRFLVSGRVTRHSDYITTPRSTGYRAVHVIMTYDDRQIEVQLRTRIMHEWAFIVERLADRFDPDIKNGRGPAPIIQWLRTIAESLAHEETGTPADEQIVRRLVQIYNAAVLHLSGGRP